MNQTIRKVLTSKYLIFSVAAVLLYALVGFFAVPMILRWYVPKYAQHNLHCRATVDKFRINPFLLTLEVDRFSLHQADNAPLVAFDRFFIDLEISSLLRWAIVLREVALDKPDIHVVVEPDGTINFEQLVPPSPQPPKPAPPGAQSLPFILQSAAIREGQINVVDKRQSTPAGFTLQGLDLHLQDLATVKEHNGTYHLAATTDDGGSLSWEGEIRLSPLRSKGKLTINALQLASLWGFFRDSTNLEPPAGQINLFTEYQANAATPPLQMTLEGLRLSLADLGLKLLHTEKPFFHLKKMDLEAPRFDLATRECRVGHLLIEEGGVAARINEAGSMNLQQIVRESLPEKHQGKEPPPPAATDLPFKVQADAIEVKNIALALDDASRKTPVKAAVAGADLHMQANLELGGKENKMALLEIASEMSGIAVHSGSSPAPLFAADKLTAEGGMCDLGAQSFSFARIAMRKGHLDAGRDAGGNINWQQLLLPKGDKGGGAKAAAPQSASVGPAWKFLVKSFEVDGFSSKFTDLTTSSKKPVVSLQAIKARVTNVDGTSPMGFTLDFQVEQGGNAKVKGTVNPAVPSVEADIEGAGLVLTSLQPYIEPYVTLTLQSAATSAQGHLRYGIPGDAQQVAYAGSFSLTNLRLTDSAATKPYLSWDAVELPQCKLSLQPNGLEAAELKISKPVGELIIGEDKTLNVAKVLKKQRVGKESPPPSKPPPKNATNAKQQNREDGFAYHISKVQVEKGDIAFADLSLRPRFQTRIHDLKGTVTGLSSVQDAQAKVQLDGQVDQYGTAKISGVLRPYNFGRASDIDMVFHNLELKNLSPYSGKFAGRLIKSGKISADLKYKLQDYKMIGENKIVIDNLLLGEHVNTPEAVNLPLDLAIALLKDTGGRIDIGLPVTGDLKDPHFRIGSLIWKMLTNLITKTTTAPFRALGGLVGGSSEHFEAIEFDPGNADLLPPEKEKLVKLADALKSRPQLKLIIQGRYSPDIDGMELKERNIRKMVAARLGTKLGPNDIPGPLDFTDSGTQTALEKLSLERFGKAALDDLEKGFEAGTVKPRMPAQRQAEKGKKAGMVSKVVDSLKLYKVMPGGKSSEQATLWAGELYTRLVEKEQPADTAFLQLAESRAQAVAANLGEAQIPKDRVSIKAAEPLSAQAHPAATLSLDAL